jgi:glycosyltransferase involved in cell wall biosynthesis
VDGTSVDAIDRAIVRLAADPELRRRMGEAGRQLVTAEYTWDAVTERIRQLSETIIKDPQPARGTAAHRRRTRR